MKIISGDKGSVDFYEKVEVTLEQKQRIINFFKANYKAVRIREEYPERDRRLGPEKMFLRQFIDEEKPYLLNLDYDVETVAKLLARPVMTVAKKRGELLPAFMKWSNENGRDMVKEDMGKLIDDFVEYQKQQREAKKQKRRRKRQIEKEIEELEDQLLFWHSEEKRKQLEQLKTIGGLKEDIDELIERKVREIEEELKGLEEEEED